MFITFEGINGSGKSTQAKMLADYLKQKDKDVVLTKEPGGSGEFSMKLRKILCETNDISKITEMFLLFADRKEHIDKVIQPALNAGKIVICDRYIDSTFAYQCCDDLNKFDLVKKIHQEIGGLMPDKTFFIDISVAESEYRLAPLIYYSVVNENGTDSGYKKYDELKTEHMQKILDVYRHLATTENKRICPIDGTKTKEEIHREIIEKLGF